MTPYVFAYAFYFAMLVPIAASGRSIRWGFLVASIPMAGLVFLRGLVGVDMPVYEEFVDLIRSAEAYTFTFEPLFEYAVLFLSKQIVDSSIVLAIFSAMTTALLFFGSFRIERQPYLLAFCIVPYFYLDMTMNGIRYGLAFSAILFGAHFLATGRRKSYLFIALAAASIHISSALLAILLIGLLEMRWRIIIFSIVFGIISSLLFDAYLDEKLNAYKSLDIEAEAAGLAPLALSGLILMTFWLDKAFRKKAKIQLLVLTLISISTYFITQFSYAGLRFQTLNLFLIYAFLACFTNFNEIKLSKRTLFMIVLIGIVGAAFRLRNFSNETGQGIAPFAPYHFFWEM